MFALGLVWDKTMWGYKNFFMMFIYLIPKDESMLIY